MTTCLALRKAHASSFIHPIVMVHVSGAIVSYRPPDSPEQPSRDCKMEREVHGRPTHLTTLVTRPEPLHCTPDRADVVDSQGKLDPCLEDAVSFCERGRQGEEKGREVGRKEEEPVRADDRANVGRSQGRSGEEVYGRREEQEGMGDKGAVVETRRKQHSAVCLTSSQWWGR